MSPLLITATTSIVVAAVIYTIAVVGEYRSRDVRGRHVAMFWTGLVFDTIGTTLMGRIAGGFELNVHGVLGVIAIVIMLVHAGWASVVLRLGAERLRHNFHHFSITAWSLWMVSLVTGFVVAMSSLR